MNSANPIPLWVSVEQTLWVLVGLLIFMWVLRKYHYNRWVANMVRAWVFLSAFTAWRGDLANLNVAVPLFFCMAIVQFFAIIWYVYCSKTGTAMLQVPQWVLIGGQAIRIAMEMSFGKLAAQQLFPSDLTYLGLNFDVMVGFLGLAFGILLLKKGEGGLRKAMIAFNLLGLASLARVSFLILGSLPTKLQFLDYSRDTAILAVFPMQWIPFFMMPLAFLLHLKSLRKIFSLVPSLPASASPEQSPPAS